MRKPENKKSQAKPPDSPVLYKNSRAKASRNYPVPQEEIECLKREVDLVDLVRSYGVRLKRQGKDYSGLCPFHNDKSPSLLISPDKNLWNCLGACAGGGSTIDWVMKSEKVDFLRAVKILREKYPGLSITPPCQTTPPGLSIESPEAQGLLHRVIDYYHATLIRTPAALQYLQKRGITDPETLKKFKIGFADRTLGKRIPGKQSKGGQVREQLIELGIFRRSSGHEHFRGSIVIPVIDETRVISEIYGRKIGGRLRPGTPLHLYLSGPHRGVFNVQCLKCDTLILCEAAIDALTYWDNALHNVTFAYGANGFTGEMKQAILKSEVKRVLISFDPDKAGDNGAKRVAGELLPAGIECYRVTVPGGMDVNEFACKHSPARENLEGLIKSARRMGNGKLKSTQIMPSQTIFPSLVVKKETTKEKKSAGESCSTCEQQRPIMPSVKKETAKEKKEVSQAQETPKRQNYTAGGYVRRRGEELEFARQDRIYRVRGFKKNLTSDTMRITLRVLRAGRIYIDTLELYNARQRLAFAQAAAEELRIEPGPARADLTDLLLELEHIRERQIEKPGVKKSQVELSKKERAEGFAFLRSSNLLERILDDFARCGLVGEKDNALIEYLAMTSRMMDDPLALIIQSLSAAGKTTLMNFALDFMPTEAVVKYTSMSGQSLFYMGETDLKHKILAISEEKGAERATYPLKIMQSEGELCMASAGKDMRSGRFITHEYRVEGPANILLATTALEIDEEFANRCLFINADEEREQTRAIQEQQRRRETLEGLILERERKRIRRLHQNAQRLLRPVTVVNPYAHHLSFLDNRVRYRRDQPKYLALIRACALLHQYRRPSGKRVLPGGEVIEYIEVTLDDIALANRLFARIMGTYLDELSPQTRKLLSHVHRMVGERCAAEDIEQSKCLFTRREVREYTGWSDTQLKVHLDRLADMEYLLVRHGQNGRRYVYELVYQGQGRDGSRFALGLLDVEALRKKLARNREYDENLSG